MYENLALLAVFVFLFSLVSGGLKRTPISGPIVFTAFGVAFGPLGLGLLSMNIDTEGLRTLAELTLALVLFTDAANANLGVLSRNFRLPERLLLGGLPLTILLGFGFAVGVFPDLTAFEAALLATMLAPTDAALGKAVVTDPSVPPDVREGLNVESGLNDGICVPILFLFLGMAGAHVASVGGGASSSVLKLFAEQIGIGAGVGIVLALVGGGLFRWCVGRDWMTESWRQLPVIGLAGACFALAQVLGGSGFIASFTGGLLFGWLVKEHKHMLLLAAEGTGDTFGLITWVIFGAGVVGPVISYLSWEVVLYAVLSLTVVRMLPVFIVLAGMKLSAAEKLFVGWFGPRGLATVVFAVIVFDKQLPGGDTITITAVCTIMLSILAHGLSANPLVALLASRIRRPAKKTAVSG